MAAASAVAAAWQQQQQQQLAQEQRHAPRAGSAADRRQDADAGCLDITYSMYNGARTARSERINMGDAKREIPTLRLAETDFISFRNSRVEEILQMMRYDDRRWRVESLLPGDNLRGRLHYRLSTTAEAMNFVDLFFGGADWMQGMDWTSDRIPGFDDGEGKHSPLTGMWDHQDGCDVERRLG